MAMPQGKSHDVPAMTEYGDHPSVMILADGEPAAERARASAERAGRRVSAIAPVVGGLERLARQVAVGAVLVEVDGAGEGENLAELERLLGGLDAAAEAGRYGSVVAAPPELIDFIAARAPHRDVFHLCGASEVERVLAIALASARRPLRLHDGRRPPGTDKLQQLGEEVGRIASLLASLSEEVAGGGCGAGAEEGAPRSELTAGRVRAIIRGRRLRDQFFRPDFFADPAWDMLLDLMAARLEKQRVAVSSLCIAAAVPPTTALRWIKTLTDQGLFVRQADPQDGRRVYIELSDEAAAALEAYLSAVQRISPLSI
ncbi:MAG TPA: winged helix DNA-binding protein [Allosphingosinicella sp.]